MPVPSLRILIVEDHDATIHTLADILARRGHTVTAVKWASEAIAAAEKQDLDLVISDIGLPDLDGWALLTQVRKRHPTVRAIALTGYGMAHDVRRSYEAGYDIHITKPPAWLAIEHAIEYLFTTDEPRPNQTRG